MDDFVVSWFIQLNFTPKVEVDIAEDAVSVANIYFENVFCFGFRSPYQ